MTILAWLCAAGGGFLACALLTAECLGRRLPDWSPLQVHMWGRCVLIFLAGIFWLLFTNM